MNMGEKSLSYTEILHTPIKDLYMLQDIQHEIDAMKTEMIKNEEGSET